MWLFQFDDVSNSCQVYGVWLRRRIGVMNVIRKYPKVGGCINSVHRSVVPVICGVLFTATSKNNQRNEQQGVTSHMVRIPLLIFNSEHCLYGQVVRGIVLRDHCMIPYRKRAAESNKINGTS